MTRRPISRRTMLRGLGGVTIGLPFLEEMITSPARAEQPSDPPIRAFNVFFGLGIPSPLQEEGYEGVLEPLIPLRDKLLIMRHVDQVRADRSGDNAHYDGAAAAFTATAPNGTALAGGPSLDQVIRSTHYPDGLPSGVAPTLVAGTYFRRNDRMVRYVHSFNEDGTAAASMQESPRELFARIFGTVGAHGLIVDPRRERLRRSVLDTVVEQSKFYTGSNSPLGASSRARLAEHFERIREYERRAFEMEQTSTDRCRIDQPGKSQIIHGESADPGGEGIDITLDELINEWRLLAELYALAIQCDRARFGSITFLSSGERIRLKGDYEYDGRTIFHFDDSTQRKSGGANGCSHEWWHAFNEKKTNEQLRSHAHMKMREIAYFLSLLDGPDSVEANGRTILENTLFTISTESGDGRHNDVKRELSGVFHAITGANGRFKTGEILDLNAEGIDVYNTMIDALGASRRLGPADREHQAVDAIRV